MKVRSNEELEKFIKKPHYTIFSQEIRDLYYECNQQNITIKTQAKQLEQQRDEMSLLRQKIAELENKLNTMESTPQARLAQSIADYIQEEVKDKLHIDIDKKSDYYSSYYKAEVSWY